MLRSIGTFGKQLVITFRDVDPTIERGKILKWKSYFISLTQSERCLARQTSRNHKNGYVIPQSFPPLPEVYEEPATPTLLDHARILQAGQPAIVMSIVY